jgi:hypothetical protein
MDVIHRVLAVSVALNGHVVTGRRGKAETTSKCCANSEVERKSRQESTLTQGSGTCSVGGTIIYNQHIEALGEQIANYPPNGTFFVPSRDNYECSQSHFSRSLRVATGSPIPTLKAHCPRRAFVLASEDRRC